MLFVHTSAQVFLNFQYDTTVALVRITNLTLLLLFICHFNGCLQWMVPMFFNFPEDTWVTLRDMNVSENPTAPVWSVLNPR